MMSVLSRAVQYGVDATLHESKTLRVLQWRPNKSRKSLGLSYVHILIHDNTPALQLCSPPSMFNDKVDFIRTKKKCNLLSGKGSVIACWIRNAHLSHGSVVHVTRDRVTGAYELALGAQSARGIKYQPHPTVINDASVRLKFGVVRLLD